MNQKKIRSYIPLINFLRKIHRHKVVGLNHIKPQQKTIIAINHSLATYDALLLFHAIYEEYGIFVRPLADRLFFKIPMLNEFVEELGVTEGNPKNAKGLLQNNEIIVVAPGGMREALRPSSEMYQIKWNNRKGFAKLSIECETPIVLAVCPRADEIYKVYDNPITKTIYRNYRIDSCCILNCNSSYCCHCISSQNCYCFYIGLNSCASR